MTIRIVTDSTCDLPEKVAREHGITVVPSYIHFKGKSYLDGIDISRKTFYEMLVEADELPTTSPPSTGDFIEVYKKVIADGASEVVSIHISHTLSTMVNVASIAADDIQAAPVTVIDSGQLSMGLGLLALEAAKTANAGGTLDDITAILNVKGPRTHTFAKLNTLEYLRRGGRLNSIQHGLISMLDIKPILKMNNGISKMEMVRTNRKGYERLFNLAKNLGAPSQVGVVHTNAPEQAAEFMQRIMECCTDGLVPLMAEVTPVIGTHVGPGVVGVVYMTKEDTIGQEPGSPLAYLIQKVSSLRH